MSGFAISPGGGKRRHRAPAFGQPAATRESGADLPRSGPRQTDAGAQWRSIEVRHLAALVGVAHEESFRRAADRLGYVQSAISNQIAQLERAAGTRLVERASGSSTVRLTPAGHVLVGHADEIIARLEAARLDLGSIANRAANTVRVAGLEQFEPQRLACILSIFRERYPRARVSVEDAESDELNLKRLSAGLIDLAVCELPLIAGPFLPVPLEWDPYVLVVAANSRLAARSDPPTATEVSSLRLMILLPSDASSRAAARLRELGIEPRSRLRPGSVAGAQALVAAGLGEAIVPRSQLDPKDPRTVAIQLPGLLPGRTLALVAHSNRERSTAVRGFIAAAMASCGLGTKTDAVEAPAAGGHGRRRAPAV
jgi:DNA-binding transcriptional LysR family regulator